MFHPLPKMFSIVTAVFYIATGLLQHLESISCRAARTYTSTMRTITQNMLTYIGCS